MSFIYCNSSSVLGCSRCFFALPVVKFVGGSMYVFCIVLSDTTETTEGAVVFQTKPRGSESSKRNLAFLSLRTVCTLPGEEGHSH